MSAAAHGEGRLAGRLASVVPPVSDPTGGEHEALGRPRAERAAHVNMLVRDPGLAEDIAPEQRTAAERAAWAHSVTVEPGAWDAPSAPERFRGWLGLLVLEGLLARHVEIAAMGWTELLGQGDLVLPWTSAGETTSSLPAHSRYEVLERTRLAVLDRDFAARVAPWPEVAAALVGRAVERSRWLTYQLAAHQPAHIDERVWMVLWHLADRFGRVTPRGVELQIPNLTHEALAQMLGARRPTVTSAVGRLAARGLLTQEHRGAWVLHGDPRDGLERDPAPA
jgi:CRP/FNR family transcriptional regulator, cyclic AMP receptor protein